MSPYEVDVLAEVTISEAWEGAVREAAVLTLGDQSIDRGSGCTILLSDDARLQTLNRTYLGIDKPTDVLSFPSGEPILDGQAYLGDVAISVPMAQRQAEEAGHPDVAELKLLTVHAVLHLLGYDHEDEQEKAAMWSAQSRILGMLGVELSAPKSY